MLKPIIRTLPETKLIGQKKITSFAKDETFALWKSFAPRIKEIKNKVNADTYAVDIYPETTFFQQFDPKRAFEKWAAIAVTHYGQIPEGLETLVIPKGIYAVFNYKGRPSDAMANFQYIYGDWLPNSKHEMDDRPYFALMGDQYKGEHTESEETFWIPIRPK